MRCALHNVLPRSTWYDSSLAHFLGICGLDIHIVQWFFDIDFGFTTHQPAYSRLAGKAQLKRLAGLVNEWLAVGKEVLASAESLQASYDALRGALLRTLRSRERVVVS